MPPEARSATAAAARLQGAEGEEKSGIKGIVKTLAMFLLLQTSKPYSSQIVRSLRLPLILLEAMKYGMQYVRSCPILYLAWKTDLTTHS